MSAAALGHATTRHSKDLARDLLSSTGTATASKTDDKTSRVLAEAGNRIARLIETSLIGTKASVAELEVKHAKKLVQEAIASSRNHASTGRDAIISLEAPLRGTFSNALALIDGLSDEITKAEEAMRLKALDYADKQPERFLALRTVAAEATRAILVETMLELEADARLDETRHGWRFQVQLAIGGFAATDGNAGNMA